MTTRNKIIAGFIVMMVLLAGMALVGNRSLSSSADLFAEYDYMARINDTTSEMHVALYTAAYHLERFNVTYDSGQIASAQKTLDGLVSRAEADLEIIKDPKMADDFRKIIALVKQYKEFIGKIEEQTLLAQKLYNKDYLEKASQLHQVLNNISSKDFETGNAEVLQIMNDVWETSSRVWVNVAAYSVSFSEDKEKFTIAAVAKAREALKRLDTVTVSYDWRENFATLNKAFAELGTPYDQLMEASQQALSFLRQTEQLDRELTQIIEMESTTARDKMLATSQETTSLISASQTTLLGLSLGGLALGVLLAALILMGLIKALRGMEDYARAVAQGNFTATTAIREKGEIGNVMEALRAIQNILESLIKQCRDAANRIACGEFNTRLVEDTFNGEFKSLASSVNTMSISYTSLIDSLPVSVFSADHKHTVLYANTIAKEALGEEISTGVCGDSLSSVACKGNEAGGKSQTQSEVTIYPGGVRKEFVLSSIPLRDLSGKDVGFVEVLSDITQIKDQQSTMLRVAADASNIANRVADASQQLASQVEQISRGAEIQKERVESTASAMTEMNSTVMEVASNAGQASEQSELTRKNAESGAELVNKVVHSINQVNEVSLRLQNNMQDLGQMAESIGGVMNVISDIADQTNLLALNAAIEAARAGEAGRGFAVVADEVRKLAEKTMEATQEVGSSITAIQNSAQRNVTEVSDAVSSIGQATELANSSGTALHDIVSLAATTSSVVTSIATAAEEQSAASDEITRAINEINTIVGETSEGMVHSSRAVQELSRMSQELLHVMEELH